MNNELTLYADELQVCRIDHYLGKETVQNILMFRFSNSIFEQLWNRNSVDHVQITVSEQLGVGGRGGYNSEYGAYTPEAYERLLLDALVGDSTLFIRRDEVEIAWQIVDSIRAEWKGKPLTNREFYSAGTWGPVASDDMLAQSNHAWHEPRIEFG